MKNIIKSKIKMLVVFSVAAVIASVTIICITSSDAYKLSKATDCLIDGNAAKAIKVLTGVTTPEADVMRGFSAIVAAECKFKGFCDTNEIFGVRDDETYSDAVDEFYDTVGFFFNTYEHQLYLLPEKLFEKSEYYRDVCTSFYSLYSAKDVFTDMMEVFVNGFIKNQIHLFRVGAYTSTNYFTLNDLNDNITTAEMACNNWNSDPSSLLAIIDISKHTEEYVDLENPAFSDFMSDCDNFISSCDTQIDFEQNYIESQSEQFELYDHLELRYPDSDYSVSLIAALPEITAENFNDVPDYFVDCLQFNLLRYYLFYC